MHLPGAELCCGREARHFAPAADLIRGCYVPPLDRWFRLDQSKTPPAVCAAGRTHRLEALGTWARGTGERPEPYAQPRPQPQPPAPLAVAGGSPKGRRSSRPDPNMALSTLVWQVGHFVAEQLAHILLLHDTLPAGVPILAVNSPQTRRYLKPLFACGALDRERLWLE
eukprot:6625970-Prymnesium_polylepis.2